MITYDSVAKFILSANKPDLTQAVDFLNAYGVNQYLTRGGESLVFSKGDKVVGLTKSHLVNKLVLANVEPDIHLPETEILFENASYYIYEMARLTVYSETEYLNPDQYQIYRKLWDTIIVSKSAGKLSYKDLTPKLINKVLDELQPIGDTLLHSLHKVLNYAYANKFAFTFDLPIFNFGWRDNAPVLFDAFSCYRDLELIK